MLNLALKASSRGHVSNIQLADPVYQNATLFRNQLKVTRSGDKDWLPQCDFLLCLDAGIKDHFPQCYTSVLGSQEHSISTIKNVTQIILKL